MGKDSWDIALVILTGAGALFTACAAIATAFAARGAYKAADVALAISAEDAKRQQDRFDRRAEAHAAFMFNEIAMVYGFIEPMHARAAALTTAHEPDAYGLMNDLAESANRWQLLIDRIPIASISELPDECAAATAGSISSARFTIMQATSLWDKWGAGVGQIDRTNQMAGIIVRRCLEIRGNLQPYLKYARERFGSEIE